MVRLAHRSPAPTLNSDPTPPPPNYTSVLLTRFHGGDQDALGELVERNITWIESYVRRRLGAALRRKDDTQDIVQEALVEFMEYGPRFVLNDEVHFRALVARIVRNVLADRHAWYSRKRRDMHRERAMPGHTTLMLDGRLRTVTRPDSAAARSEESEWIRLALELMKPEEREVIVRHHFDSEEFAAIATAMQTTTDGARKRFGRALPKLFGLVRKLQNGQIDAVLDDPDEA